MEIEKLWQKKTKVIPVMIGTLGAMPKQLEEHLKSIGDDPAKSSITGNSLHVAMVFLIPK